VEQWKAVAGFEGWYEVSDEGRVRSMERVTSHGHKRKQHVLSAGEGPGRYLKVDLSRDNKQTTRLVHQLVLETFVGPRPEKGMQACHFNGERQDNRLENLSWGSTSDNAFDRSRHGRGIGEAHPMAVLTEEDVLAIRAWPYKKRGIYQQFWWVSRATVDHARSGRNWKTVA
jgi:hypothetical protein